MSSVPPQEWKFDNYTIYHFGKRKGKNIIRIGCNENNNTTYLTSIIPVDAFFSDFYSQTRELKKFSTNFKKKYPKDFDDKVMELVDALQMKFPATMDDVNEEEENEDEIVTTFVENEKLIAEQVYKDNEFVWAIYKDGKIEYESELIIDGITYLPVSNIDLIRTKAVLMPTLAEDYGSFSDLYKDTKKFASYWWIPPNDFSLNISSIYPFWTYLVHRFEVTPYLHLLASFGEGKSRFLHTIGGLCRKACFMGGVDSEASLTRMIDKYKGTLLIDEGDFQHNTQLWSVIMQILNLGYHKNQPRIKTVPKGERDWDLGAFDPYGPKIIATRKEFEDEALNSRCIPIPTTKFSAEEHPDIINLNDEFEEERQTLINKLTRWGLENYKKAKYEPGIQRYIIEEAQISEPRLIQIMAPVFSAIPIQNIRSNLLDLMRKEQEDIIDRRKNTLEHIILTELIEFLKKGDFPTVGDLADSVTKAAINKGWKNQKTGEDFKLSPQLCGMKLANDFKIITEYDKEGKKRIICHIQTLTKLARAYGELERIQDLKMPKIKDSIELEWEK